MHLISLVPALVVFLIGAWAIAFGGFTYLGVASAFDSTFVDLRYLTATAECYARTPDWSLMSVTCDPFGRLNNYPSPWVWVFATAGATEAHTEGIAWIYLVLLSASIWLITWGTIQATRRLRSSLIAITLIAVSPPTWLALERGSNEILIFASITVAWLTFSNGKPKIAAAVLGISTLLKFFPAGAMIAFRPTWRKGKLNIGIFIFLTGTGLLLISQELGVILERTPQPSEAAFGAALLARQADLPAGRIFGLLLFAVILFLYMAWLYKSRDSRTKANFMNLQRELDQNFRVWSLFAFGAGPLVFAYLLGTNYDYRLIVTIPIVAGLSLIPHQHFARSLLITILCATYLSYQVPTQIQVVGDIMWLFIVPFLAVLLAGSWISELKSKTVSYISQPPKSGQ
jgi:hypothetical protein